MKINWKKFAVEILRVIISMLAGAGTASAIM